jgi:hypothetical protein
MLFLGLGTGLGNCFWSTTMSSPRWSLVTCPIARAEPLMDATPGQPGTGGAMGKRKWRSAGFDASGPITSRSARPDYMRTWGRKTSKNLTKLPPHCRMGNNDNAFIGGARLWDRQPRRMQPASEACRHPGSASRREGACSRPGASPFFLFNPSCLVADPTYRSLAWSWRPTPITRQPAASGPAKSHESGRSLQADQKLQARYFVGPLKSLGLNSSAWSDQISVEVPNEQPSSNSLSLHYWLNSIALKLHWPELVGIETVTDQETPPRRPLEPGTSGRNSGR